MGIFILFGEKSQKIAYVHFLLYFCTLFVGLLKSKERKNKDDAQKIIYIIRNN